jgi:uncharacterized protein (TIGR03083 family)
VERVTTDELLATIRADRARFDAVLERVPPELLEDPILPGDWSVKDVLAHIVWGDREGSGVMRARALVGSDLWQLPQDERNAIVVRESRSRALDEVMAEYRSSFDDFLVALEALSEEELNEPDRLAGLPEQIPGWRPWRVIYDPDRYADHGDAIASTIERRQGDG